MKTGTFTTTRRSKRLLAAVAATIGTALAIASLLPAADFPFRRVVDVVDFDRDGKLDLLVTPEVGGPLFVVHEIDAKGETDGVERADARLDRRWDTFFGGSVPEGGDGALAKRGMTGNRVDHPVRPRRLDYPLDDRRVNLVE